MWCYRDMVDVLPSGLRAFYFPCVGCHGKMQLVKPTTPTQGESIVIRIGRSDCGKYILDPSCSWLLFLLEKQSCDFFDYLLGKQSSTPVWKNSRYLGGLLWTTCSMYWIHHLCCHFRTSDHGFHFTFIVINHDFRRRNSLEQPLTEDKNYLYSYKQHSSPFTVFS